MTQKCLNAAPELSPLWLLDRNLNYTVTEWGLHTLYAVLQNPGAESVELPAVVQLLLAKTPSQDVLVAVRDLLAFLPVELEPYRRLIDDLREELEITVNPQLWGESLAGIADFQNLPLQFRTYVHRFPCLELLKEMMEVVRKMHAVPEHRPFCDVFEVMYETLAQVDLVKQMYADVKDSGAWPQIAGLYDALEARNKPKPPPPKAEAPKAPKPWPEPKRTRTKRKLTLNELVSATLKEADIGIRRKMRLLSFRKPAAAKLPLDFSSDSGEDDMPELADQIRRYSHADLTFEQARRRLLDMKTEGRIVELQDLVGSVMENRAGYTEIQTQELLKMALDE